MMPHPLQELMPSMFRRRLLLLAASTLLVVVALGVQTTRLTLAQGERWRRQAEGSLSDVAYIPTVRGRILDRHGLVLAEDKPCFDVAVLYPVITGQWAFEQGRRDAIRADRQRWNEMNQAARERLIAQHQVPYDAQIEGLWTALCELGGVGREELEERKETIKRRVQQTAAATWLARLERRNAGPEEPADLADVAQPIGEQLAPHPLLFDLDDRALVRVKTLMAQAAARPERDAQGHRVVNDLAVWKCASVQASKQREYPLESMTLMVDRSTFPGPLRHDQPAEVTVEGVGIHVLGGMRTALKEDQAAAFRLSTADGGEIINLRGYLPGDRIGSRGIERSQEELLRGARGRVRRYLDDNREERTEPAPGRDVRLTLDVRLQARLQALMDPELGLMKLQPWHHREAAGSPDLGRALNGAAVVMEVSSGQVLAAVSVPTYSRRELRETPDLVWKDKFNQPYLNRALGVPYQPGSTLKPLVLAAAITEGKLADHEHITCNGTFEGRFGRAIHCWIYRSPAKGHGPLPPTEALARSCNVFFCTLGRRLGAERLCRWYEQFGLAEKTGCEVGEEVAGFLGHLNGSPLTEGDAANLGIGQGPVAWTVMQAANTYASIARGGYLLSPTLLLDGDSRTIRRHDVDLGLDPASVRLALDGLDEAVNQTYGTGRHLAGLNRERVFSIEGVRILGKSGTAETLPQQIDTDGDGRPDAVVRRGDHAWFIGLVQRPGSVRPDYVVAVVVEYAGSGAAAAGPIVNQILHALRAEGYL